jgi:hypothetical protein
VGEAGWGRTVNISRTDSGVPEALHAVVPFDSTFRVRGLGDLSSTAPAVDLEELAKHPSCPWESTRRAELTPLLAPRLHRGGRDAEAPRHKVGERRGDTNSK